MKLISINVGLPRAMRWRGRVVTTGIFKEPVAGPVKVRKLNIDDQGRIKLSRKAVLREQREKLKQGKN